MEWWSTIPLATVVVCVFGYLRQGRDIRYAKWLHDKGFKDAEYRVAAMKGRDRQLPKPDEDEDVSAAA